MMRWQRPGEFGISKVHYTQAIQRDTHIIKYKHTFFVRRFSIFIIKSPVPPGQRQTQTKLSKASFFFLPIQYWKRSRRNLSLLFYTVRHCWDYIYIYTHTWTALRPYSSIHSFIHKQTQIQRDDYWNNGCGGGHGFSGGWNGVVLSSKTTQEAETEARPFL